MTGKTTEPFYVKIMRMFIPVNPKIYENNDKLPVDIELIDPLVRFEKSILEDSESKRRDRAKESS
ncbi:MAG: hypothetical protein ACHQ1H_08560 [Nitrososphaerales archaeon]